jgi:branched-chain amino acid transport system ATP-binding protein
MSAVLQVAALDAGYGSVHILHRVELRVEAGQRWAVLGRNGVGKTTLLKAIMGLADVTHGRIEWDGQDITQWTPRQRAMAGLGYVPQTRDIFPSLTVAENLLAGLKGRPQKYIQEAYELFPRLAQRRDNAGTQLSGGEQQMLSVARTLLGQPRLLLLDEPLEGLAPIICQELMHAFEQLARNQSVAVVLVEQKTDAALRFADQALILERGAVVHTGTSAHLKAQASLLERHVGLAGH